MKRIWVYITAILLFLQLSAQDTTIVQMEYFLDVDPGYGLGESITITNNTVVDANFNIGTDTINLGFHTLYTRALDEHGKWGIPEGRLVYVDQNAGAVVLVDSVEYFIDEDPGYGNGVLLDDPITPAALVNVIDNIPTDTLVTGFHSLLVRVKGQGGGWGIPEQRLIYVDESGAIVQVDTVEFFFDTDPGYGNGGLLGDPITPGAVVDIVDNIMTDTLSTGFHSLYIRPKGEGGLWGIPEGRLVYVDQGGAIVQVDTIEYFFDVDPGYGNGTLLANPITPGVLVNITDAIPTDTLTTGFHTLMVRAKGEGGLWGIPEQRLIYVDQNVSGMVEIDTIEYFFDTDPGYGNGYVIGAPITASTMVNVVDSIPTDTLSIGFHRLFMRGKGVGGGWGIPEQRMVYVDPSGAILANVSELEYFFDTDPGYDQGLSIVISPAEPEPFREVLLAANALPEGEHTVSLRAKNEDGVWGIAETATFSAFGPGRQLDSASLVAIYQLLDGANWTDNTNWLSGNIDNWFGVTVVSDRVDSLQLPDNNLSGIVPKELGYIDELKKIDLSVNALTDTLPSTMSAFNSLQTLLLHDNALSEFESNISTISSLNTVALDSNFFDFGDLEDIASIANLTYSNQAILGDQGGDSLVSYGDSLSIDLVIGGINNQYQWFLDGDTIPSADLSSYILGSFTEFDTGTYFLKVRNTLITDLELTSKNYRAFLSDFEEDSLALVSLYNATDGANWVDNSGWLSSDLSAWNGVTLANSRVSALDLSSNNLTGIVPGDLSFADSLVTINLASNALSDTIPVSFNEFAQLETLDLSENDISSIPALNSLTNLDNLSVEGNKLQFGDLESNIGVTNFSYAPQDSISVSRDTLVESNADVLLSFIVSGVNNTYQWYRDEGSLTGETASSISLPNVVFEDEGDYRLEIENSQVPGLTLTSGILTLGVTSLARDSAALRALYDATGGDNWSPAVNWTSAPIAGWGSEVTILNNRVTQVNLQGSGLTGEVPGKIRDITSLETLDFGGNNLTGIPNLSQMPNLTSLDVTENRLEFDDLEPNVSVTGLSFANQQDIGVATVQEIPQGTDLTLDISVGGANNEYQWFFEDTPITAETATSYLIDSINFEDMGVYHVRATSPVMSALDPNFFLKGADQTVYAHADISFTPIYQDLDANDARLDEGEAVLLGITEPGQPYDSLPVISIGPEDIVFEDIRLGDYLFAIRTDSLFLRTLSDNRTDSVRLLPTYFESTPFWEEADVLALRTDIDDTIDMQQRPRPLPAIPDGGEVGLTLESDFAEETTGRAEARRRVRRAGCSLSKRRSSGRPEEDIYDLFAYKETDDQGRVTFENLPADRYRLNIQYPGIPMDSTSFVEFDVGDGGVENNTLELEALVTEAGIAVELIEELGFYRQYFKDLSVYPNPTSERLQVHYSKLMSDDVMMRLMDRSGKTILEEKVEKGLNQTFEVDVSDVIGGIYILNFYDLNSSNKSVVSFKIVVNH